ncbi:MAG TPA: peptide chain release factor 3 [Actinomycetota bacterium]|nr:peptide chain release factor 3 [Actinomycetota bacterium]
MDARRTFAIISHPDAGKTTLTEKFLLYSGAITEAGQVKARKGRRSATSDWMDLERQRGISITSTVLQFSYRGTTVNLLDTPGHEDFSEDTYRVLTAVDAAVMVIDAAKGIEPQTMKLFEVCARRGVPLITFVNKCDRPGREPLELLDEIEDVLKVHATPVTWPVGNGPTFKGVVDRRAGTYIRFERTPGGANEAPEQHLDPARDLDPSDPARDELALLAGLDADHEDAAFLRARSTPVFFGSALWNFGVRSVLDAVVDLAPGPSPRLDVDGNPRGLDSGFSGFVFKLLANMDPNHRDRIAFVRVCSGVFERGMNVVHEPTGRSLTTRHAHLLFGRDRETVDEAYPGDIIGLVSSTSLGIGDTIYAGEPVRFPPIPSFPPEHFMRIRNRDTSRYKQFRRGIQQLSDEGVVQVLRYPDLGDQLPVLAACGPLQFDVAVHRLENEFGARVQLEPIQHSHPRRTDRAGAEWLRRDRHVQLLERSDGTVIALFDSPYHLQRLERDEPDLVLEPLGSR